MSITLCYNLFMEETWKPIPEFELLYEASSEGRIRSVSKVIKMYNGGEWTRRGTVLRPHLNRSGYLQLHLCKNGKTCPFTVHRLVATTWLENPEGLPEVNHKNEIKTDNRVVNLEWCSRGYNITYGTARERTGRANGRPVVRFTLGGKKMDEFYSGYEAQRQLGILEQSINLCCLGRHQQAGGFRWKYKDDDSPFEKYRPREKPVIQRSMDGKVIAKYDSILKAEKSTGINNIGACCRGKIQHAGGFIWRYA